MDNVLTSAWCPAGALCRYCAALCCLCITGPHNGMNTSANPLFKLNFQDRLVFIGGSFPIGSTLVWLASSHGDPPCFLMSLVFIFAFPFFFFFLFSSSAMLSSVTTRVNLSLQSLLDQLRWWLTLCRSADVSSLGSPFLVQTDPHYWLALRCTVNINNLTLLSLVIVNTILLLVLPTTPLS